MDKEKAVELFRDPNPANAQKGFDYLYEHYRLYLTQSFQRDTRRKFEDCQDIAQDVFVKAWNKRSQFTGQGFPAWWAWIRTAAKRRLIDIIRAEGGLDPIEWPDDDQIPAEERDFLTDIALAAHLDILYQKVNMLWLGLDSNLTLEQHQRQLLVAQRYYLDGETEQEILADLPPMPGERPLTQKELRAWLVSPSVLRHLAYQTLYFDNDRMVNWMLGKEDSPLTTAEIAKLLQKVIATPTNEKLLEEWTTAEIAILLWRYWENQPSLTLHKNKQALLEKWGYDAEKVSQTLVSFEANSPSYRCMQILLSALSQEASVHAHQLYNNSLLWERLIFQYYYHDELPQKDMLDRTQPAAREVGFHLAEDQVNSWTSGKRLFKKLLKQMKDYTRREDSWTNV